jgi:UV DNA damage endonuclease
MSLSVCCQFLHPRKKRDNTIVYENVIDEKNLQLGAYKEGKYSEQRIIDTYQNNVQTHIDFFPKLIEKNIKSFRISSSIFPLFDFAGNLAKNDNILIDKLAKLGKLFIDNDVRITTHPGQFTIINSDSDRVIQNSIRELEYHAWVFDMMGLAHSPYYAINIHGGKRGKLDMLVEVTNKLPDNVKKRLTFENDERCYNVKQLLEVYQKTGVPVVLDSHHYNFNSNDISFNEAFLQTMKSWGNIKPLQHISNTEEGMENGSFTERRSHSKYIRYIPELQLQHMRDNTIDVDIEAKMKNFALIKMREQHNINV